MTLAQIWAALTCLVLAQNNLQAEPDERSEVLSWLRGDGESPELNGKFGLLECIRLALQHNHKRPASRFSVAIARAQHKQALSAYWPQVSLNALAEIRSEAPTFIYPETSFALPDMALGIPEFTIPVPATTLQTPPTSISLPANAFGPGFPATPIAIPVPSQDIAIPGQSFTIPAQEFAVPGRELTVPEQEIELADRATYGALVSMKWLLFDGGMRRSLNDQTKQGIAAAREDARRTDLEIINDVTQMYHGAVLAKQLLNLGTETLARMDATLTLTEKLYQGGSLQVKKTDYLRNKVMVEGLRMLIVRLDKNSQLARSALVHSMGLSWTSAVNPKQSSIAYTPFDRDLTSCIGEAFNSSPEWNKVNIGVVAANAKVREERSHYLPKVGLLGNAHHIENNFDTGAATDANLQSWSVGIGVEIPLFTGFRNKHRVAEAKARAAQIMAQKSMLREGLALKVKNLFLTIKQIESQEAISSETVKAATENRSLTERAYRNDMIEAKDVFEAQMMEALVKARQFKYRYDQVNTVANLDAVVGRDFSIREAFQQD